MPHLYIEARTKLGPNPVLWQKANNTRKGRCYVRDRNIRGTLLGDKMRLAIQPWGMGCIYLEKGTVSNVDKARWTCQVSTLVEATSPRGLAFLNGTKAPYGLTVM